jgi:hypothetical protein
VNRATRCDDARRVVRITRPVALWRRRLATDLKYWRVLGAARLEFSNRGSFFRAELNRE